MTDKGFMWFARGILSGWAAIALGIMIAHLLIGCGGMADADDAPEPQDVEHVTATLDVQASETARARNWCCESERAGVPVLSCGYSYKPSYAQLCYCQGVASVDGLCTDPKPFTPGTLCTSADLVCW
jgi:hypothetical protein